MFSTFEMDDFPFVHEKIKNTQNINYMKIIIQKNIN